MLDTSLFPHKTLKICILKFLLTTFILSFRELIENASYLLTLLSVLQSRTTFHIPARGGIFTKQDAVHV